MSAVCILAPTIIASWPAISAAVAGAAAALGMSIAQEGVHSVRRAVAARANEEVSTSAVEVTVENAEVIGETMVTGQEMVLLKGDVTVRVFKDERGQCKVCIAGPAHSEAELRQMAEEFIQKVTQMYVYNKVMTGLKSKGFTVISEKVAEDDSVHLHVRQQVG